MSFFNYGHFWAINSLNIAFLWLSLLDSSRISIRFILDLLILFLIFFNCCHLLNCLSSSLFSHNAIYFITLANAFCWTLVLFSLWCFAPRPCHHLPQNDRRLTHSSICLFFHLFTHYLFFPSNLLIYNWHNNILVSGINIMIQYL